MPGAHSAGAGERLAIIGASHRSISMALSDRFALIERDLPAALDKLRVAGLGDGVLIATCARVELVAMTPDVAGLSHLFAEFLADQTGIARAEMAATLYRHEGEAALRHLFAVASALDSLILGEPQVLGQVKAAYRAAAQLGMVGAALDSAFGAAFAAARRVRGETRIAEGPVSIAAAALQLSREIHGDLERCAALLLGPAEMGELMAEQLRQAGLAHLVVCGPPLRAQQAARRFSCNLLPLEDLDKGLVAADIVIASLGSGQAMLTAARVAAALRRRPRRPLFVIDVAIPGDAEPAVNDLDGAFLYDLGDLERVALDGRARREAASREAWQIIDKELAAYTQDRAARHAVPAILALRRHVEALRLAALAEAGGDAERATRLLANRLLHDPSEVLRALAATKPADVRALEDLLRRLFRLSGGEERME